jgi:hypothetical protein
MLPRIELFERWAIVLRNAANGGSESRRINGKRPSIGTLDLLSRISRLKERDEARRAMPGVTGAEKAARFDAIADALREAFAEGGPGVADLRSSIISLARGGKIEPNQAEAWAAMFGWKILAGWAEPSAFNPMEDVAWSLSMAAAWIRWRDSDKVRRQWGFYIKSSTTWIEVRYRDSRHFHINPMTDFGYYEIDDDPTNTKRDLLLALSSGRLNASGYRDGGFVEIPAVEWTVLQVVGFHDDGSCHTDDGRSFLTYQSGIHEVMTPDGERKAYADVSIWRDEVLKAFPPAGQEDGKERYRSGGPGRPTAMQFVEAEARRRRQSGEASSTLAREAASLHEWCRGAHREDVTPTAKTIEGRIRVEHNAWKLARADPIPQN